MGFVCGCVFSCRYSWWHYSHPSLLERLKAIDVALETRRGNEGGASQDSKKEL